VVGGHYDFLYTLPGPIPGGRYAVSLDGELQGNGTVLEAELDDLPDAGAAKTIFTETYTLDGGERLGDFFDAGPSLPPVLAACGDTLRLRLSVPAGSDAGAFYYFSMNLGLP